MDEKFTFPIKGFREGLLVSLGDGDWKKVTEAFYKQIEERSQFFKGAKVAVDVGERALRSAEISKIRNDLADLNVTLFALLSKSESTETAAETLGLSTAKSVLQTNSQDLPKALFNGEEALIIKQTLRSGASVKYSGNVIVDGDVNPGAEIKASGSIYVWGKLRGNAYAGVNGSEKEIIAALEIMSSSLRIADILYEEPILKKLKPKKRIVKAYVDEGKIKIVDWEQYKRLE